MLLYPFCWWRPAPLFSVVSAVGDAVLAAYILAACARLAWVWFHPCSETQREQFRWIAAGLCCGLAPLLGLNLLPNLLIGHDLLPARVSILALLLLLAGVGAAIVQAEFLGITSLMRRRTLRAAVSALLLLVVATGIGLLTAAGAQRWGWPAPATAALAGALTALGFLLPRATLIRWAEALVLHDVYDSGDTLHRVSVDLAQAPPSALGALVVTRLSNVLNLTDALLLTPTNQWSYAHPRTADPIAVQEAVVRRALALFTASSPEGAFVERAAGQPILFLPIHHGPDLRAVLCLGPKRSEDSYTTQDQIFLDTLVRHLGLVFSNQRLQARLEEMAVVRPAPLPALAACASASSPAHTCPALSPRETETLRYLAAGLTNRDIAARMYVVEKTVHKHVAAILDKLEARNRTEAVAIARQRGLLPPE